MGEMMKEAETFKIFVEISSWPCEFLISAI